MTKTIGQMIDELESDLEMRRAVDLRIDIWKNLFKVASPYEKKKMLITMLTEMAGFTQEEIKNILK